ncbi:hypothetical protein ACVME5_003981 [Bradyrhizobium liaoningense]
MGLVIVATWLHMMGKHHGCPWSVFVAATERFRLVNGTIA